MVDIPTGTVTFLLSDIADSTALWESHPLQMDAALRIHDGVVHENVERRAGVIVKHTGDGICAAFDRTTCAAEAALDCCSTLNLEHWPTPDPLQVRFVLHTGECFERDHDYFGSPLCVATRLIHLTPTGTVWATELTAALLSSAHPDDIIATPVGIRALRGISRPVNVYEVTRPDPPFTARLPHTWQDVIRSAVRKRSRFGNGGRDVRVESAGTTGAGDALSRQARPSNRSASVGWKGS
jgi:class 3 adenylate cyclase